jgi:hypothetical protein
MSIEYTIDRSLIVVTPYGVNAFEDVATVFEKIIADPAFNAPARILFDARHTDYGPPSEELEALAEFLAEHDTYRQSRWAIVANSNTLVYCLTRMFCCLAESQGIYAEPFSDYEEARAWLVMPEADRPSKAPFLPQTAHRSPQNNLK